jgi:hypothetical protein
MMTTLSSLPAAHGDFHLLRSCYGGPKNHDTDESNCRHASEKIESLTRTSWSVLLVGSYIRDGA